MLKVILTYDGNNIKGEMTLGEEESNIEDLPRDEQVLVCNAIYQFYRHFSQKLVKDGT